MYMKASDTCKKVTVLADNVFCQAPGLVLRHIIAVASVEGDVYPQKKMSILRLSVTVQNGGNSYVRMN